jgi:hypothetical protein
MKPNAWSTSPERRELPRFEEILLLLPLSGFTANIGFRGGARSQGKGQLGSNSAGPDFRDKW